MAKRSHKARTVTEMARAALESWEKHNPGYPLTPREARMFGEIVRGYMSIVYTRAVNAARHRARRRHA